MIDIKNIIREVINEELKINNNICFSVKGIFNEYLLIEKNHFHRFYKIIKKDRHSYFLNNPTPRKLDEEFIYVNGNVSNPIEEAGLKYVNKFRDKFGDRFGDGFRMIEPNVFTNYTKGCKSFINIKVHVE